MKKVFLLTMVSFLVYSCTTNYNVNPISQEEFKVLYNKDSTIQLLDVRTQEEYSLGYIKGAVLLDVKQNDFLEKAMNTLDKSKPVYIYCRTGNRSHRAVSELIVTKKFSDIYYIKGGYTEWKQNLN